MDERRTLGQHGEDLAVSYLEKLGWQIVERNWRYSKVGEIDIIAIEPNQGRGTLVFCEVKAKSGRGWGQPLEAITVKKLQRLHRLACVWMSTHKTGFDHVRIDAIGIMLPPGQESTISHAKAVRL